MTEEQEVFLEHIQKRGLKRTAQRDLILEFSCELKDISPVKISTASSKTKILASAKPPSIAR